MKIGNRPPHAALIQVSTKPSGTFVTIINAVLRVAGKIQSSFLDQIVYRCLGLRTRRPHDTCNLKLQTGRRETVAPRLERTEAPAQATEISTYSEDFFSKKVPSAAEAVKLVYQVGERVLKIPRPAYKKPFTEAHAQKLVDRWNKIFANIYDGKFSDYASAKPIKINYPDGSVAFGIDTPHIEDGKTVMDFHNKTAVQQALSKTGFNHFEDNIRENVVFKEGYWLPIDVDLIYE